MTAVDPVWRLDPRQATKTAVLGASMHVERLAGLAGRHGRRPTLVGLFQHAAYFERSRERFARLAEHTSVVVAFADDTGVPPGVRRVRLDRGESLVDEWTVLAVGRGVGAALVATETGEVLPARTLERGRGFAYEATHRPARVGFHTRRVAGLLGERLDPAVRAALHRDLGTLGVDDGPLAVLQREVERSIGTVDALDRSRLLPGLSGDRPAESLAALRAWAADAGPRAPALGAVAVRVADAAAAPAVAAACRTLLPPTALLVAPTPDTVLVVVPGHVDGELDGFAEHVVATARGVTAGVRGVVGTLDPRHLHVDALLLAIDRARPGGLVAATR